MNTVFPLTIAVSLVIVYNRAQSWGVKMTFKKGNLKNLRAKVLPHFRNSNFQMGVFKK